MGDLRRATTLSGLQQRRPQEHGAEGLGFDRVSARAACFDLELVEDRLRDGITRRGIPLLAQPPIERVEPVVRVEYAPDDELRGDGAVPVVLLEAERDVVPSDTAQAVQLRSLPEGNR